MVNVVVPDVDVVVKVPDSVTVNVVVPEVVVVVVV